MFKTHLRGVKDYLSNIEDFESLGPMSRRLVAMTKEVIQCYKRNKAFSPPFTFIDLEGNWHEQYGLGNTDGYVWLNMFYPTFFDSLPETTWLAVINYWISKKSMDNLYMRGKERIKDIQNSMINNKKPTIINDQY